MENKNGERVIGHSLSIQFGNLFSACQIRNQSLQMGVLDSVEGAVPYLTLEQIREKLHRYTARSVVLAIPLDRGGVFNTISGSAQRTYNVFEVGGATFQDRVANALMYLQWDRSERKAAIQSGAFRLRVADIDLRDQRVPQEIKALRQQLTGAQPGPFISDIYELLKKSSSWRAFQATQLLETNGGEAFLLIGHREIEIAHFERPSVWGDVSSMPSMTAYAYLGGFLPISDLFLELVENIDGFDSVDRTQWIPFEPE